VIDRRRAVVGVVVHTDPAALHGTLDALSDAVRDGDRVVLVPDGPDPSMTEALASDRRLSPLAAVRTAGDALARGNAAAFNALAAARTSGEGAVVFLEGGARPAPDAIDRLVTALDRPGVGISGPSTNDAWNDQRALPDGTGDAAGLGDGAARLAAVHGDVALSLAPLHSIAEVCFAVAAETLDAVGAADEGFGLGPCWEMEYAARAARAGLEAVWVGAAYVWRAPQTRRRAENEARLFVASRRRYQDRLCALRLSGATAQYDDHCIGDSCSHFAPADRIVTYLPLRTRDGPVTTPPPPPAVPVAASRPSPRPAPAPTTTAAATSAPTRTAAATPAVRPGLADLSSVTVRSRSTRIPLVSCVMPTADRPEWVAKAIAYFRRQDHPARQLVIVDDGTADLAEDVSLRTLLDDPTIVHVRLAERASIGAKRNLGCQHAGGDVLVQWDDDDWYGPSRLSRQVAPIVSGAADITGLRDALWFDVPRWRFRSPTPESHRHLFVEDVHGGTLAFTRRIWDQGARYPDGSLAEDAWFLRNALRRGARLVRLPAAGVYLYVRHGSNSWQLRPPWDRPDAWDAVAEPPELAGDRDFYAARSDAAPRLFVSRRDWRPTVSAVMPTADRHQFLPAAIAGFLAQRYADAELVVVDDGVEPSEHLVPDDPRVEYVRLDPARSPSLGAKRNLAVEAARGEVIVHFDDDDWSHPDRIGVQVDTLAKGAAELCGLARILWWDPRRRAAWRYTCPPLRRPWVAGNTLAYLRSAWARAPFPPHDVGEDTAFVWGLPNRRAQPIDDERLVIGTLHAHNTSTKHTNSSAWTPVAPDDVLRIFSDAVSSAVESRFDVRHG
jgi:glycosyltransferase involved in cell wall biosynthesis